ncbi:MAG: asparaginase [Chloroflexota bacterium]
MIKRIVVITTGGTIAMKQDATAGGAVPTLVGHDFLSTLPDGLAEIELQEHCNLPSAHFTLETVWALKERVAAAVARPEVDGVILTHGTDVMEESAYLLDLTVPGDKPVVLTGAMRTVSDLGYEGYANLAAALRVAADDQACGLGTLVVMNNDIHAARFVTKTHTLSLSTFQSPDRGPLGRVDGDRVVVAQRVSRQLIQCQAWEPNVALIKLTVGMDEGFLRYALAQGVRGVVLEALGGGRIPPWWLPTVRQAIDSGVAVVIASRCLSGRAWDGYGYAGAYKELHSLGALFADNLNGPKARIRLMCVLGAAETAADVPDLWVYGTPPATAASSTVERLRDLGNRLLRSLQREPRQA